MTPRRLGVLAICLGLTVFMPGAAAADYAPDTFAHADVVTDPDPGRFSVCHGGTCAIVTQVALDENEWVKVTALFVRSAASAEEERSRIAAAVAQFEVIVGAITDTSDDRAENGLGNAWWSQMDCIDESTNTTTYLRILARRGLLRFHRVEARSTRGYFFFGWPHTTAVVRELETGAQWAVDSWFHDNGRPPAIVPLEVWKAGWRPAKPPPAISL